MEKLLSIIGYMGTGLVIGAYAPQIRHLWTEHCSAGISERAYALWVLSSALFLGHSITIGDPVFMVTQLVNMIALLIILVLARRFRNQVCTTHASHLHTAASENNGMGDGRRFGLHVGVHRSDDPRRRCCLSQTSTASNDSSRAISQLRGNTLSSDAGPTSVALRIAAPT